MSTGSSQLPTASTGEQAVLGAIPLGVQDSRTEQGGQRLLGLVRDGGRGAQHSAHQCGFLHRAEGSLGPRVL